MTLVRLIFMAATVTRPDVRRFSKIAVRPILTDRPFDSGPTPHQRVAARDQRRRQRARYVDERPNSAPIRRGRSADTTGEQRAETTEADEADFEAHLRHRQIGGNEQLFRAIEACIDQDLVRRPAEGRFEQANEVIGRQRGLPRRLVDAHGAACLLQKVARTTQANEKRRGKHGSEWNMLPSRLCRDRRG